MVNTPFIWDPQSDKFFFKSESTVFNKIALRYGLKKDDLYREFGLRTKLLINIYKKGIFDFVELRNIINEYYRDPKTVLAKFNVK